MSSRSAKIVAISQLAILAACGPSRGYTPPPDNEGKFYCLACQSDTDCGGTDDQNGFSSNGNYCICADSSCTTGACATACRSDSDCLTSAACALLTSQPDGGGFALGNICEPVSGSCTGPADAGPTGSYYCQSCLSDTDCGGTDNASGISSNGNYCVCADAVCDTGFCATVCSTDADCSASASCFPVTDLPDGGGGTLGSACQPTNGLCSSNVDGGTPSDAGTPADAGVDAGAGAGGNVFDLEYDAPFGYVEDWEAQFLTAQQTPGGYWDISQPMNFTPARTISFSQVLDPSIVDVLFSAGVGAQPGGTPTSFSCVGNGGTATLTGTITATLNGTACTAGIWSDPRGASYGCDVLVDCSQGSSDAGPGDAGPGSNDAGPGDAGSGSDDAGSADGGLDGGS